MRPLFLVAVALLIPIGSAQAQAPQTLPKFAPYLITEQDHNAILNFLGDVPSRYANPLISKLSGMETAAQIAAKDKKTEKPKGK